LASLPAECEKRRAVGLGALGEHRDLEAMSTARLQRSWGGGKKCMESVSSATCASKRAVSSWDNLPRVLSPPREHLAS
jgi:hypothetical protein